MVKGERGGIRQFFDHLQRGSAFRRRVCARRRHLGKTWLFDSCASILAHVSVVHHICSADLPESDLI